MIRFKSLPCAASAALCLMFAGAASADSTLYHVISLGTGTVTHGGINKRGVVTGTNFADNLPTLFDNGTVTTLGTLTGEATAITAAGQVTGSAWSGDKEFAFLYRKGRMKLIPPYHANAIQSYGIAINSSDAVLVGEFVGGLTDQSFIFDHGTMTSIDPPAGLAGPTTYSMNDAGDVVGVAWDHSQLTHAVLYHAGTTTLIEPPGSDGSYAAAINNHGQIAGGYWNSSKKSLMLVTDGAIVDLPEPPGCHSSVVNAMNDDAEIVGRSDNSFGETVAYVYKNGRAFDLNGRLDAESPGWDLIEAYGVNDKGQISGLGYVNGQFQLFLATPVK